MLKLADKTVFVTGAARGQGAAEARRLVAEGARVMLTDVLDELGEALVRSMGERASYLHLDVCDEEQWLSAVQRTVKRFGGLDVLVNNAGVLRVAPLTQMPVAEFRFINDVNLTGPFLGMQAAVPHMLAAGNGSIINIASVNGIAGSPGMSAYAASKHGLIGLTRSAAMELGAAGIRVNVICPGGIDTAMVADAAAKSGVNLGPLMAAKIPMQRLGQSDEIAGMVAFLASDDSSYCNGGVYVVDGGLTAGFTVG